MSSQTVTQLHTPLFSLNTWNSYWDFTLLNNTASLCLSKSISILWVRFLFLNFHIRNMRWWMENKMMRNMFPYWFDCWYDGINHALALVDHSPPHKNYIQFNFFFYIFIKNIRYRFETLYHLLKITLIW